MIHLHRVVPRHLWSAILLVAFAYVFTVPTARATVKYTVSFAHRDNHLFAVSMMIPVNAPNVRVALPAWNALYQTRDFSFRLHGPLTAGTIVRSAIGFYVPDQLDRDTWRVCECASPSDRPQSISLTYSIQWDDPGPFNSQLNEHHAFMNLAEILMYLPDRRSEDVEVQFANVPADWKLITELPPGPDPNSFVAADYDALVDAPVEAGTFDEFEFDNAGAHFRVVVDGKDWNRGRLEDGLRRITGYEVALMGGPPFKEYTFFFHIGPYAQVGGGGMEHANSTAIGSNSTDSAIAVAAHEFFHAWNVKRIRPQTLEPVDYSKEQYTRALWFAEGVTSTYSSFTLERSGLWTKDQFYSDLAQQITELESRPAHKWQSAEESSLDAWLEKYDSYNLPDRSISYYNKGQLLGVMLDLAIRDATDNRKSLDDVMRLMNDEYAKQHKFYNDSEGVRGAVEQVSGASFDDFFRGYVAGVGEIPFDKFLAAAGLELHADNAKGPDLGFTPGRPADGGVPVIYLEDGGAAESAGLQVGDVILLMNGQEPPRGRRGMTRDLHAGDTVKLHVNREGQEIDISFVLGSRDVTRYSIAEMPNPSDRQRRIREGFLRGTTN